MALDLLTDSLIMVGQHGVYCASSRNPSKPALDLQAVLGGMEGAKALIQSVMEELRKEAGIRGRGNRDRRLERAGPLNQASAGRTRLLAESFTEYGMLVERARSSAG